MALATVDAALQFTIPSDELIKRGVLYSGQEITIDEVLKACMWVSAWRPNGTGQFSRRGGIVDFFSSWILGATKLTLSPILIQTPKGERTRWTRLLFPLLLEVMPNSPTLLAKKIEELSASFKRKKCAKGKGNPTDKLKNGLHIGSMEFISLVWKSTLLDYFTAENLILVLSEGTNLRRESEQQFGSGART